MCKWWMNMNDKHVKLCYMIKVSNKNWSSSCPLEGVPPITLWHHWPTQFITESAFFSGAFSLQCAGWSGFPGGQLEWADVDRVGLMEFSVQFVFHRNLAIQEAACAISTFHKVVMTSKQKSIISMIIQNMLFDIFFWERPLSINSIRVCSHGHPGCCEEGIKWWGLSTSSQSFSKEA